MYADKLLFPLPKSIRRARGTLRLSKKLMIVGETLSPWLRARLVRACTQAGIQLQKEAGTSLYIEISDKGFGGTSGAMALRTQAYRLTIRQDGSMVIVSPSAIGLQYGVITLALLLEAKAISATLAPLTISDGPVFEIRGLHVDLAREFFPPLPYLKKLINRMADLKLNTVWLYLENHFRVPGLEDISQKDGMTPEEARAISAYAAARGIDVVPATNVLSHMEGWLRLERYSDFVDGGMRSYPVLTHKEVWPLVKTVLDGLMDAFPSKNIHPGLDELLFVGTHPDAAGAISKQGKATYFADFAEKVIDYCKSKGKRVWIWDDMVLGKNVDRKEGFQKDYRKALDRMPRDVVMTHWYYWDNADGKHGPIVERVAAAKRPVVMAPSSTAHGSHWGEWSEAIKVQSYMARCGKKCNAFGYVNTHWESTLGNSYEACWPLNALSAGFAWSGGMKKAGRPFEPALSFVTTGDIGTLTDYMLILEQVQDILVDCNVGTNELRYDLVKSGPHVLWRRVTGEFSPAIRKKIRALVKKAESCHARLGARDPGLSEALHLHITLINESLNVIDSMDQAWGEYHRAARIERAPGRSAEFRTRISNTIASLNNVSAALTRYAKPLQVLNRKTGHAPYDSHCVKAWAEMMKQVCKLIRALVKEDNGLPYFEKLLNLPDVYRNANIEQLQVSNHFEGWYKNGARDVAPPKRWVSP